jgi:long-chain acyl-CoA synthetase
VIGQAIAVGDGRPYNVALITLDPDVAPPFEQQHGREALEAEVTRGVEAANEQLARVEQIKKFKLLEEEWQAGGDELTPTMKLKRKPIHEKYAQEIEALYGG